MNIRIDPRLDYEEKWKEGMKDWEGELPERMKNDNTEEVFWQEFIKRKENKTDPYAKDLFKELSTYLQVQDHVLEIGPGWGNYTFSLAENVKFVTAIDSSNSVLQYLKDAMIKRNLHNVDLIHEKWEEAKLDKQYDVIVGINCFYRMYEIKKALTLINNHAKRLAIIGMTTGPMQPHYIKLNREYGYDIKFPRRDYIDLLNLLYELGIYAECKMIPLTRVYQFSNEKELIEKCSSKILTPQFSKNAVREALTEYVQYKNGSYFYEHQFNGALIIWKPVDL